MLLHFTSGEGLAPNQSVLTDHLNTVVDVVNSFAASPTVFNPRGAWAPNTPYATNDEVTYLGSSYWASHAVPGVPTFDATQWNLLGQAGAAGPGTTSITLASYYLTVTAQDTIYRLDFDFSASGTFTNRFRIEGACDEPGVWGEQQIFNTGPGKGSLLIDVTGLASAGTYGGVKDLKLDLTLFGTVWTPATGVVGTGPFAAVWTATAQPDLAGGIVNPPVNNVTASATVSGAGGIYYANATSGAIVLTLPTAVGAMGTAYTVKKIDTGTNSVTLAASGGQTIDGASTQVITHAWDTITARSNGANWFLE